MRRFSGILFFGLILLGVYAVNVYAQQGGTTTPAPTSSTSITMLFTPMLAASTGIERLLEMFWNWFEALFLNFIAFVAMGWEWTRWAREEVELTTQAINQLATQLAQLRRVPLTAARASQESDLIQRMRVAEEGLRLTQEHLRSVLKSERYRSIKQALSVLAGIVLGVIVSAAANLKMFALLGITGVPTTADIVISGLVIGTGAGPMHSLVGMLQQGKETIEQTSALLRGRSELTQSELTARNNTTSCNTPPTG